MASTLLTNVFNHAELVDDGSSVIGRYLFNKKKSFVEDEQSCVAVVITVERESVRANVRNPFRPTLHSLLLGWKVASARLIQVAQRTIQNTYCRSGDDMYRSSGIRIRAIVTSVVYDAIEYRPRALIVMHVTPESQVDAVTEENSLETNFARAGLTESQHVRLHRTVFSVIGTAVHRSVTENDDPWSSPSVVRVVRYLAIEWFG